MSGGSSGSTATSTSSNSTTVNVSTSTPVTVDTADLAQAISALAGANLAGQLYTARTSALAKVASAQIAAKASGGISTADLILIAISLAGLLYSMHVIKVRL